MKEIALPELGEGIEKATITNWFFKENDIVKEKEDLVELATDKAAFNLPSPVSGKIIKILAKEGDTVKIGEILANIEENPA